MPLATASTGLALADCPDVLGQLTDGRLLGVEVKAPKGKLQPEQAVMMERIRSGGGVAFVARDLRDVHHELYPPESKAAIAEVARASL